MLLKRAEREPRRDKVNLKTGYAAGFDGPFPLELELEGPIHGPVSAFIPRLVDSVDALILPITFLGFEVEHVEGAVSFIRPGANPSHLNDRETVWLGPSEAAILIASAGARMRLRGVVSA